MNTQCYMRGFVKYKFRAEYPIDVANWLVKCSEMNIKTLEVKMYPIFDHCGDTECTFYTDDSGAALTAMRACGDSHVMSETFTTFKRYTGERL